jgi:alpha-mannosidase
MVGDVNKGITNHKVWATRLVTGVTSHIELEPRVNATALLVFGNGDGGGGALAKMLENVGASISAL